MDRSVDRRWRRSSRCATGTCFEVAEAGDAVLVRSSLRSDDVLVVPARAFEAFVNAVKDRSLAG